MDPRQRCVVQCRSAMAKHLRSGKISQAERETRCGQQCEWLAGMLFYAVRDKFPKETSA